jgi:hypothetical protein
MDFLERVIFVKYWEKKLLKCVIFTNQNYSTESCIPQMIGIYENY